MRHKIFIAKRNIKRSIRDPKGLSYKCIRNLRLKLKHNALWSPERSGNHWVRFIVEYLTGFPTCGCNRYDPPIFMNSFPNKSTPLAHVKGKAPYILYKSHDPYDIKANSVLILLIRNYYEYIMVNNRRNCPSNDALYYKMYLNLLTGYDKFTGTKILIYYEDLILKPEREILRIKNFLGGSYTRYKTFINRYDYYAGLSRTAKNRNWNDSHSGEDITFHQSKHDEKELSKRLELFHSLLAEPEYQKVKPYIKRYMT